MAVPIIGVGAHDDNGKIIVTGITGVEDCDRRCRSDKNCIAFEMADNYNICILKTSVEYVHNKCPGDEGTLYYYRCDPYDTDATPFQVRKEECGETGLGGIDAAPY